jgi:hypothetical protein
MTPQIQATLGRSSVGVGDPFVYTVDARGTGTVRVVADTGAFAVVSAPRVTRSQDGGQQVVRMTQTLACLDRGCAPGASARRVFLPAARVTSGDGAATVRAAAVTVVPRVPVQAVTASPAQYHRTLDVPAASTALPAGAIAALLIAAAVLLVAAAALVLLRGRRRAAPRAARSLGLADALRLLRESAGRPVADRRRAADFAGRLTTPQVRDEATRVAWAPPDPDADDVGALADRIEAASR